MNDDDDKKVSLTVGPVTGPVIEGTIEGTIEGEVIGRNEVPQGCGRCPACLALAARRDAARAGQGGPSHVAVIGSPGRGGLLELLMALAGGGPGMQVEFMNLEPRRPIEFMNLENREPQRAPPPIDVEVVEVGEAIHRQMEADLRTVALEHKTAPARHFAPRRSAFVPSFLGMFNRMLDEPPMRREAAVKLPDDTPELPTSKRKVKGPNLSKREMLSRQRQHGGKRGGR